jgi:hypothetical protein
VTIDRAKVAAILLTDRAPVVAPRSSPQAAPLASPLPGQPPAAGPPSIEGLLKQLQGQAGGKPVGPDDLLKQLEGGGSPELDELKKNLPLIAAPEVQDYIRKQVGGLIDGSLTINDIRQEAIRARDETKAAIKDLGPDAEKVLAPYLGILEKFIRETEPKPQLPPASP